MCAPERVVNFVPRGDLAWLDRGASVLWPLRGYAKFLLAVQTALHFLSGRRDWLVGMQCVPNLL